MYNGPGSIEVAPGKKKKIVIELDDLGLLAACWERRPGAWEEFILRFNKLIYFGIHRTCKVRGYRPEPEELEDLFNDVLVHLIKDDCKKLRLYKGYEGATVATWIRTITVRFVIDYLRSRSRAPEELDILAEGVAGLVSEDHPTPRPDEVFEEREEQERLVAAIETLSDTDQRFIELYFGQGLAPDELADILGISVNTVYSRVNRVKDKIQAAITERERK